ncbi:prepilin-type N-terminal cleavage/methylation domain-containing protein [Candidatus Parcubacteria bacterium]|nr:prepilin-type N-terminal cleavage/methylation domain-containing protein [Candidatus Parcubacteria bacterium]
MKNEKQQLKNKNYNFNQKGFTFIEVFVSIAIAAMMISAATSFIIYGSRANLFGSDQDTAVRNARKAGAEIVKEIREAAQGDNGDYLLDLVEEQSFSFYSNIDDDDYIEKIRYFLEDHILKKEVVNPSGDPLEYSAASTTTSTVALHINNQTEAIFTYYDTDNNLISDPTSNKSAVRLIHISLKVNVNPNIAPQDYYVQMEANIRNLKDNL